MEYRKYTLPNFGTFTPMLLDEALKHPELSLTENVKQVSGVLTTNTEGYQVEMNGITTWQLRDNIEDFLGRVLENGIAFSNALEQLKDGCKIARKGWNGKGMYLFLVKGKCVTEVINDCYGDPNRYKPNAHGQESGVTLPVLDAIYMKTADNKLVPWLASQTDILADDWVLVE